MAEDCTLAAGEQRGHLAPVGGGHRMPGEVDATVDLVEAAVAKAKLDLVTRYARIEELRGANRPVLARRQAGDRPVGECRGGFARHMRVNPPLARYAPLVGLDDFVEGRALGRLAAGPACGGD